MLCSHCPINDSSGYLHNTVYLAVNQVMMDCKNFITSTLFDTGHRVSQRGSRVAGIFPFSSPFFLRIIDLLFFIQWVYYSLTAIHSPHKFAGNPDILGKRLWRKLINLKPSCIWQSESSH